MYYARHPCTPSGLILGFVLCFLVSFAISLTCPGRLRLRSFHRIITPHLTICCRYHSLFLFLVFLLFFL
uniref:Uncharacterized protein n=1 Tax=Populus trichocarpa TaxID=3694 RepID=A9P9F8_POPTR|nr:unknown [Populus trichocarpa]